MFSRHLITICILFSAAFIGDVSQASAQNYEAEYEELLSEFPGSLDDVDKAQTLVDKADALYQRIRQHRKDARDKLTDDERDQLRDFYKEVRNFKGFVRVIGQLHNAADLDIDKFDTTAKRLGLVPRVLQTHKESGLELIRIDIGSFGSILTRNRSGTTYTLKYSTNDPKRPGGFGTAHCENYSVVSGLFNSRDREIEGLEFVLVPVALAVLACD